MADRCKKIALGTVQFGLRYGVANQTGQVAAAEIAKILQRAVASGMDTLDTAIGYGDSESRLGAAGVNSWRIVSKLPQLPHDVVDVRSWVDDQVRASRERLEVSTLDGILLHHPQDLLGSRGTSYRAALDGLKSENYVRSIGISIYEPSELDAHWSVWRPDIVQAPFNVLDRRLLHSGWLEKLSAAGTRVHVRSVFLQGLLAMAGRARPSWFLPWESLLDRWYAWCERQASPPIGVALAFATRQPVERVIVGVDSDQQLQDIIEMARSSMPSPPDDLYSNDLDLIQPSRWKLT